MPVCLNAGGHDVNENGRRGLEQEFASSLASFLDGELIGGKRETYPPEWLSADSVSAD